MAVTVLASCECADAFSASVSLHPPVKENRKGPFYIEASLCQKKSPMSSTYIVIENVALLSTSLTFRLTFESEIRDIGFWSVVSIVVRPAYTDSSASDLIGRFTLPVFNKAGVLLAGQYLVLPDAIDDTKESLVPSSVHAMSAYFPDATKKMKVQRILESFHADLDETHNHPWGLEAVTNESLMSELQAEWSNWFSVVHLNVDQRLPVLFSSETSKPSMGLSRQLSSAADTMNVRLGNRPIDSDSVLANWMVINGPIGSLKSGGVSGTGYVADLRSCMSPSPTQVVDYELFKEHPAATKANKIQRFANSGKVAAVVLASSSPRPNADEMALLNDVILQPMRDLSVMEHELVLKFMWSLTTKKQALLKVILVAVEAVESAGQPVEPIVTRILSTWTPVDVDGALSLLGEEIGNLSNRSVAAIVRRYAVNRLSAIASAIEIQLFLFQLVQSLRYDSEEDGTVSGFLIEKACRDEELATMLFWHLQCDAAPQFDRVSQQLWSSLGRVESGKRIKEGLELQCQFRERLLDIAAVVRTSSLSGGISRSEILREAIRGVLTYQTPNNVIGRINLSNRLNFPVVGSEPVEIPIPVDPNLCLVRIDETRSFCIKSAKSPFVITCETLSKKQRESQPELRRYMFKTGDDLRQDQLIIQLITLFNNLFKSYGLDLKLTPYRVLATSVDDGFVEFVSESSTLSSILENHGNDLMAYFRSIRPKTDAPYGVDPAVLDTFSRSCAGYCAITYVLGIGDRHLDNLMVTPDGRLFHIDFGYILGRDPKPFPPPMKLCREMIDAMGSTSSPHYRSFVSKCTQAFLIIRRHASLLISLLYLAAEANLKDMREQDATLAILKVQKRLMPEVSDEIAEQQMLNLINESTSALFPVVMEKLHKWAVYWRN